MSDEQTAELIDISKLKPVQKGQEEWRFYCPMCPEKRGKLDKEGKFYWNVLKNAGYCFKCGTSFFPEGSERQRLSKEEVEWNRMIDAWERRLNPNSIFEGLEFPKEVPFSFPELTQDLMRYLKRRNPFLIPLIPCLGIRAWKGQDTGVVLPFFYNQKICGFQSRFVTKRGMPLTPEDRKYYTSPGVKPPYCPFHIFSDFKTVGDSNEITLCEGVFDAIALAVMGMPNPIAVLGDKLTPLQMWDIRHLSPVITKVYICLDDVPRSEKVGNLVKKFLPAVGETEVLHWWAPYKDPEEFLTGSLGNATLKKECINRVRAWVDASTQQGEVNA